MPERFQPQKVVEDGKDVGIINPQIIGSGFVATEELIKIKNKPKTLRPELIKEFKQKLVIQQKELATAQAELITEIKMSPDLSISELYNKILEKTSKTGLNQEQKNLIMDVLNSYFNKREKIKTLREKYPDPSNLFEFLFKNKPVGRIELIEGPINLYFKCYDFNDYLKIYFLNSQSSLEKLNDPIYRDFIKETANSSMGINLSTTPYSGLDGVIMAENSSRKISDKMSQEIFDHEEQHSIHSFFKEKFKERDVLLRLEKAQSEEEKRLALINLFNYRREFKADRIGKNEILAFLRAGSKNLRDIKNKLLKKYDFIKDGRSLYPNQSDIEENDILMRNALEILDTKFKELQPEFVKKYYINKYYANIKNGIAAIKKLQKFHYSNNEIIALLTHEPLEKWIKIVNRISKN